MSQIIKLVLISLILSGCYHKEEQTKDSNNSIHEKTNKISISEIFWKDYNEIIYLLANKYNIDTVIVKPLILEYLKIHNTDTYFILTYDFDKTNNKESDETIFTDTGLPKEKINVTVNRLSLKYSIDKSKLSSFLYDFYIFEKLNSIE